MSLLPRRLNTQIVLLVSCILLATGAASGWMTARDQTASLLAAMRLNSSVMARNFADSCARYLLVQDYAGLESYLLKSAELPDIRRLQVSEPNGTLVWNVERSRDGRARAETGVARVTPPPGMAAVIAAENGSLVVWQPIEAGNVLGWLRADFSLSHIREAQLSAWENTLLLTLAWVVSGAFLIILMLRPTVRSIGKLAVFAKQLDERKGAQIAIGRQPLEIEELGKSLNEASAQLLSTEQQLLHDRERLRESEEKFRQVNASAQDAIIILDQDGAVTDWNAAAEKIFGYAAAEAVGMDLHARLAPPRQRGAAAQGLRQFRDSGTGPVVNRTLELAALRRDGTEFPIELSISSAMLRGRWHAIGVVRDISERKRAEQAALGQFKLAEAFFNHSVSCLAILDRKFNFVRVNEAYARAARKEIGEFAGRNHFDMYPSDAQAIFEEVVRSKRRFTTFTRAFVYPDQPERGTTYWDWTLVPILDEQGEVEYLVFSLQEVTKRKRAEEIQRAAALYARSLIEANLDPLVTISAEGKITDVNKSTEEVTGRARDHLIGTDFADYFTEPDKARAGYQEVLARGYVRDYPLTIRHSGGRTTDVLYNASVYRNEAGELQGVFAAARDITERKSAEAVRTQLAAIVQSSHDAIIGKDLEGVITSWNPGAEKVYGYRAEEVVGKPVSMLAPQGRKEEITALLDRARRGEGVMNFETERFRRDGERIDVSLDLSPIRDTAGRITGVSTIARDITEKKQAERALRKVNRALKALSSCNETLIHAGDEMQLLGDICRIIVDIEGYRLAWVGYAEHDAHKKVRAVAQSGYAPGYLEHADITWADNERGRGPLGIAIRSGEMQVVQDVNTDPCFAPWRANAARLGYGSVLVAPLLSGSEIIGALSIHAESVDAFDTAEIALLGELAADMAFGIVTLRTRRAQDESAARLQQSMETTIQAIAGTVEMRDPYTAGHQRRVAELATAIARDLGLADDLVRGVHLAGVVHDLGKIHIPAEILSKPGKLSRLEFELIKSHPEAGYEILKGVDFPWPIAQIVLQHHERLDGSGYPRGLKADEILLEARILAVADVVEAMSSHRPYRPSLGMELALQEIGANAGKRYDADAVRACLALFREKAFAFRT